MNVGQVSSYNVNSGSTFDLTATAAASKINLRQSMDARVTFKNKESLGPSSMNVSPSRFRGGPSLFELEFTVGTK